jgi:hypothetical protein
MKFYINVPSKNCRAIWISRTSWYFFNILGQDWIVSTLSGAPNKTDTYSRSNTAVKTTLLCAYEKFSRHSTSSTAAAFAKETSREFNPYTSI